MRPTMSNCSRFEKNALDEVADALTLRHMLHQVEHNFHYFLPWIGDQGPNSIESFAEMFSAIDLAQCQYIASEFASAVSSDMLLMEMNSAETSGIVEEMATARLRLMILVYDSDKLETLLGDAFITQLEAIPKCAGLTGQFKLAKDDSLNSIFSEFMSLVHGTVVAYEKDGE
ncbi:hypothetical protein MMC30_000305 [Trapelia coarctata]|nr:hypothetical protein [Trapelia coarctata]